MGWLQPSDDWFLPSALGAEGLKRVMSGLIWPSREYQLHVFSAALGILVICPGKRLGEGGLSPFAGPLLGDFFHFWACWPITPGYGTTPSPRPMLTWFFRAFGKEERRRDSRGRACGLG